MLEVDFEDSAPIKMFLSLWCSTASNNGSWWPLVVVGGGEEGFRVWVGIWIGGE